MWFASPVQGAGRRVAILWGWRIFACRHRKQLAYLSHREESYKRHRREVQNIRKRLCWGTLFKETETQRYIYADV